MTYYLDFDRTIFDVGSVYRAALAADKVPPEYEAMIAQVAEGRLQNYVDAPWDELYARLDRGELDLIPVDVSHFVYPDALEFITAHSAEVVIVTAGRRALQERKVTRSGILPLVSDVVYSLLRPKGEVLAERRAGEGSVFIDDSPQQLVSVMQLCPAVRVYEMQRHTRVPGVAPVIHSFNEL